jgi:FRG domain
MGAAGQRCDRFTGRVNGRDIVKVPARSVTGYAEYVAAIEDLRRQFGIDETLRSDGTVVEKPITLYFRGQPNEKDLLTTTLERRSTRIWDAGRYMISADEYCSEIESFTGRRWRFPHYPEREEHFKKTHDFMRFDFGRGFDFLVYLRHHGFPSPLLDWTLSPFIALYFAYIDATPLSDCAVYCYIDSPDNVKGYEGGKPVIHVQGRHVMTDKRHFAQKADYTVATRWTGQGHVFCSHEEVLDGPDPTQQILSKIILPSKQRANVLNTLDDVNINHFTLFQTEDALVRAMGVRAFDIDENCEPPRSMRIRPAAPPQEETPVLPF